MLHEKISREVRDNNTDLVGEFRRYDDRGRGVVSVSDFGSELRRVGVELTRGDLE